MAVLVHLAVREGKVVSKRELLDSVWGGAVVEEGALARCISELRSVLGDDARAPSYIQTVPTRGYRLIATVQTESKSADRSLGNSRWMTAGASAFAVAVVAGGVAFWGLDRGRSSGGGGLTASLQTVAGPSVAVLGFRDLSKDPALSWVAAALPELLASELSQSSALRVVPAESVLRMIQELSIPEMASLAPATLARVGARLGVEYVVLGSYVSVPRADGGQVRVDTRIQKVPSGTTTSSWVQTGSAEEILQLVSLAGTRLREALGGESWVGDAREAAPHLSGDPTALRLYFDGNRKLRQFDAVQARELLEQSLEVDPGQPFGWLAISQAWSAMGYDAKATEAAVKARELSTALPREYRLWIEAHALTTAAKWDEAIEIYKALRIFSPADSEYGLLLAHSLNQSGQPTDAILLLDQLGQGPVSSLTDPRIPLSLSRSYALVGDHRRSVDAARSAASAALAEGARLVVAQARHAEASSLHSLGEVAAAKLALDEAMRDFVVAGDSRSEARASLTSASWDERGGDLNAASAALGRAQEVFQLIGDQAGKATALAARADLFSTTGQVVDAERMYKESLAIFRETADRAGEASALFGLGNLFGRRARPDIAVPFYESALKIHSEIGNREREAQTQFHLGKLDMIGARPVSGLRRMKKAEAVFSELGLEQHLSSCWNDQGQLLLNMGSLESAEREFARSLELARKTGNDRALFVAKMGVGRVERERSQLKGARATFEQVLAEEMKRHRPRGIVPARAFLATVLLELREFEEAEAMGRQAVKEAMAIEYFVASAVHFLGQTLMERGKYGEAETVLAGALDRDQGLLDGSLELKVSYSRVQGLVGNEVQARDRLVEVIRETRKGSNWQIEGQARLALGELEMNNEGIEQGVQILQALEAEASGKGWELLASKARRLLSEQGGGAP